jgi:hypothetical protein
VAPWSTPASWPAAFQPVASSPASFRRPAREFVAFEREADYVGAYYAARAGYDLTGAEHGWRDFGLLHPDRIRFAKTHPTTPVRFVQMQKVAAEIADKLRRQLPLEPELRFTNADRAAADELRRGDSLD